MKTPGLILFSILVGACMATKQMSTARLKNTYWKLTAVNGKSVTTPADRKEVHMIITDVDNQQQLKGYTGCNAITGSYAITGQSIKFMAASTRMMCTGFMDIENSFLKALTDANHYEIKGETLELYTDSVLLATFHAVYFN